MGSWLNLAASILGSNAGVPTTFCLQVGPIAEEVVFRGCFVPVLLGAGVARTKIILLSPLMFGFGKLPRLNAG